jgi:hypothetical protein
MPKTSELTLSEFLLARIAEDEASATSLRSWAEPSFVELAEADVDGYTVTDGSGLIVGTGRVLAECEAKRRIVAEHEGEPSCETCYLVDAPCPTLRLLALPYAGHEDYREGWWS